MRTFVEWSFEAAHSDPHMGHPEVHGHSYMVRVWFQNAGDRWNAEELRRECEGARLALDHTRLDGFRTNGPGMHRQPIVPPTMENIALWIGKNVEGAVEVHVWRPTLGFGAEWRLG